MLKPFTSLYNDWRRGAKWIKLKKDFIPGAGDTLDFHLVGASYTAKRARELLGKSGKAGCAEERAS
jgi:DNA ligase-4